MFGVLKYLQTINIFLRTALKHSSWYSKKRAFDSLVGTGRGNGNTACDAIQWESWDYQHTDQELSVKSWQSACSAIYFPP
jgi:hypothetical protein